MAREARIVIPHHESPAAGRPQRVSVRSARKEFIPDVTALWDHRHVAAAFVWRDVKVRFSHTVLGILWFVLQPFLMMVVITIGLRFAFPADVQGLPYPVFVASGLILWQYFASAFLTGASTFERFQGIISKVYIPRVILPFATIAAPLADLLAASLLLIPLMVYYRMMPSWRIVFLPVALLGLLVLLVGLASFVSVVCTTYKDVRHALPFAVQLLFFASPIIVPQTILPEKARILFAMNPLAGYVNTFRWLLFDAAEPVGWANIGFFASASLGVFVLGLLYFQRHQGDLVDII